MLADYQRGIPVPFISFFAFTGLRPDVYSLSAFTVITNHVSVLCFGIYDVRVGWINRCPETVTSVSDKPIIVHNTHTVCISRRATHTVVILGTAIHIIERFAVIHVHPVKLGNRQIALKMIILAAVPCFIDTAIAADHKVLIIFRVNPHGMVVHMAGL